MTFAATACMCVCASVCVCQFNTCWNTTTCASVFVADLLSLACLLRCMCVTALFSCHVAQSQHFCRLFWVSHACVFAHVLHRCVTVFRLVLCCRLCMFVQVGVRPGPQRLNDDLNSRAGPVLDWLVCSFPRGCRLNRSLFLSLSQMPLNILFFLSCFHPSFFPPL